MYEIIIDVNIFILIYFFVLGCWYTLILLTSYPDVISSYTKTHFTNTPKLLEKGHYVPISIIIPAFNEENRILNAIYSILQSQYKNVEIIVVNDGSLDHTLDVLVKEFSLYKIPPIIRQIIKTQPIKDCYKSRKCKNLTVINKERPSTATAADAVNCGLNAVTTPIFLTIDADTIVEPDTFTNILLRYLSKINCISVGGAIYVLNGNKVVNGRLLTSTISKKYVEAFQSVEYLRSFNYGRSGLNALYGSLCNPGAFTLNETDAAKEVGGYDTSNFAYDLEMTLALHQLTRANKDSRQIYLATNAISWTIVPGTLKSFWRQRVKWQQGMLNSTLKHIKMFFNPRYGLIGMLTFPTFIFFELLAPVIEMIAYISLIISMILKLTSWPHILLLIFLAWGFIVFLSLASFYLNLITHNEYKKVPILRIIWISTVEFFGFRQFRAASCTWATLQYTFNKLMGFVAKKQ